MPTSKTKKATTTSKDLFADELAKFSSIFPQFISEGKIDFDALKAFLADKDALADDKDRYAFSWAGKNDAFKAISHPSFATLKPQQSASVDFDNSDNLFIEGDNLEVLKLLQKHYHRKVKMIYIDPPYNTGKDFIYKDNFTEGKSDYFERIGASKNGIKLETNSDAQGRYHSQWLSMMYPRLFLAKQLLKDDGVIFISIDDNEQHHLKMLMNEVFGEENFVTDFIWEKKKKPSFLHSNVGKLSEYIVSYVKDSTNTFPFSIETTTDGKKFPLNNAGNSLKKITFPEKTVKFNIQDSIIEPQDMSGDNIVTWLMNSLKIKNGVNDNAFTLEGEWRYSQEKINQILNSNEVITISKIPFRPNHIKNGCEIKKMKNNLSPTHYKMETNEDATNQLFSLFNKDLFDNPKPIKLVKTLIQSTTYLSKDDIVLDFFAGSATTGHAVMDLNQQDGGNRKFILVQIPESVDEKSEAAKAGYKTISQISIERLKRAIDKNNYPTGFKVFSLAPSHYTVNQPYDGEDEQALLALEKSAIKNPLTSNFDPLDLAYEIALKQGFPLISNIEQDGDFYRIIDAELERTLIITLVKKINTDTIETLKLTTDDILVCLDNALTDTQKVNFYRNFNLRVI